MALIKMFSGDNLDITYNIQDENGDVLTLTGASLSWTALNGSSTVISKSSPSLGATITSAADGQITVSLDPADTSSLKGTYQLDAEITDSSSDVYTFEDGGLVID